MNRLHLASIDLLDSLCIVREISQQLLVIFNWNAMVGLQSRKTGTSHFFTSLSTLVMCNDPVESKDVLIASGIHPLTSSSSAVSVSLQMQMERTLIHKIEKRSNTCSAHISPRPETHKLHTSTSSTILKTNKRSDKIQVAFFTIKWSSK